MPDRNIVFVVVDDAMILTGLARLLRQLGYAALLFPSADAFARHDDFDGALCILLDINLGTEHRLKAANITVPVIYMTGNANDYVREAALRSGYIGYLTKPFSAAPLAEKLRQAAKSHKMRDRNNELKPGNRVRLSALGKKRSPRLKVNTGVLVAMSRSSRSVLVLLDGNKTPTPFHKSYVEPH